MPTDRRSRRAHAPLLAAEYFLDAQRQHAGASAVMLWDGGEPLLTSVAKDAPDTLVEAAMRDVTSGGQGFDRDIFVHKLNVFGRELDLISVDARLSSVRRVESSLSRIFAS